MADRVQSLQGRWRRRSAAAVQVRRIRGGADVRPSAQEPAAGPGAGACEARGGGASERRELTVDQMLAGGRSDMTRLHHTALVQICPLALSCDPHPREANESIQVSA